MNHRRNLLRETSPGWIGLPADGGERIAVAAREVLSNHRSLSTRALASPTLTTRHQSRYFGKAGSAAKSSGACWTITRALVFAARLKRSNEASVCARSTFGPGTNPFS